MTGTLTFEIGRRPGVARRVVASPRSPAFGMTGKQRAALSELVHGPSGPRKADSPRLRPTFDFIWFAVLALAFVLGGRALLEGVRFVHTADELRAIKVAEPHVDMTITRLPSTEALRAAAPAHSSATVSRTM